MQTAAFYTNKIKMIFLTTITRIIIIPNESRLQRSFNVRYVIQNRDFMAKSVAEQRGSIEFRLTASENDMDIFWVD